MRVPGLIAVLALAAAPFGVAPSVHAADSATPEVTRIRAHFDSVITELAARDVRDLSATQRSNRSRLTSMLASYRDRGVFPHNYDFPGQAVPYFVDRKTGTLCAVAHLLESTGRRDIVDRVVAANNNVWVAELAADTALARWLDDNGLTLDEAARIQVPYVGDPAPAPVQPPRGAANSRSEAAAVTTLAIVVPTAFATSVITTLWNSSGNADGHRRGVSWTGVVSSGLTAAAGGVVAYAADKKQAIRVAAVSTVALGGWGLWAASQSIQSQRQIARAREKDDAGSRVGQATFSPIVTGSLNNPGVGASLSLRF